MTLPIELTANDVLSSLEAARLLSPPEAARYLNLALPTLAKMRCWGGGPEYLKLGRKVVYERQALDAWRNERRVRNTSDAARLAKRMAEPSKTGPAAIYEPSKLDEASRLVREVAAAP